jgi:hypothetical protein
MIDLSSVPGKGREEEIERFVLSGEAILDGSWAGRYSARGAIAEI